MTATSDILIKKLAPFNNKKIMLIEHQSVGNIITGLLAKHNQYKPEYDKICTFFDGRNAREIGKKIFDFLKANVKYKIEPDTEQFLKSPAAILATGKTTGSDCKNYSLFTGGIIDALNRKGKNIPFAYRFSSYKFWDKVPQHVFVVLYPGTSKEIWVDAVLPKYDQKKQYNYFTDRKINSGMSLYALSGTGIGRRKGKNKSAKKAQRKEKRKKFFKGVKKNLNKFGKFQLKFALAPARNSFLAIVGLNVRSLAYKLKKAIEKDERGLKKFWENIGGNYAKLKGTILKGAKKKRLGDAEIGALPAIAAAIASATPIIIKVGQFLKKLGIKSDDVKKLGGKLVKNIANKAVNNINKESEGEETQSGDAVEYNNGGEVPEEPQNDEQEINPAEEVENMSDTESEDDAEETTADDPGDTIEGIGKAKFKIPRRPKPKMILRTVKNLNRQLLNHEHKKIMLLANHLMKKYPNRYPTLNDYAKVAKRQLLRSKQIALPAKNISDRLGDFI